MGGEVLAFAVAVVAEASLRPTAFQPSQSAGTNGLARSQREAANAGSSIMTRSLSRTSLRMRKPAAVVMGAST